MHGYVYFDISELPVTATHAYLNLEGRIVVL